MWSSYGIVDPKLEYYQCLDVCRCGSVPRYYRRCSGVWCVECSNVPSCVAISSGVALNVVLSWNRRQRASKGLGVTS